MDEHEERRVREVLELLPTEQVPKTLTERVSDWVTFTRQLGFGPDLEASSKESYLCVAQRLKHQRDKRSDRPSCSRQASCAFQDAPWEVASPKCLYRENENILSLYLQKNPGDAV